LLTYWGSSLRNSPSAHEIKSIVEFSAVIKGFWGKTFSSGCFYDSECLKNNSKVLARYR